MDVTLDENNTITVAWQAWLIGQATSMLKIGRGGKASKYN